MDSSILDATCAAEFLQRQDCKVSGIDIYTAVLDHWVRTPKQFANCLQEREEENKP